MSEETIAANDVEIANQQTVTEDNGSVAEVQGTAESNEVTQTQAFARRLKEEKQKAIDAEYSRLYGQQYGIHSKDDYDSYIERQRYIEEGKDPELYQELKHVKTEMESLKREKMLIEQDRTLSSDKVYGSLYNDWKSEIQNFAEQYSVDYNTAFTVICRDKIPQIIQKYEQKSKVQEKNNENASSSTGSIVGQGQVKDDYITFETFNANRKNKDWIKSNFEKLAKSRAKW